MMDVCCCWCRSVPLYLNCERSRRNCFASLVCIEHISISPVRALYSIPLHSDRRRTFEPSSLNLTMYSSSSSSSSSSLSFSPLSLFNSSAYSAQ
ncbi:hypothetical protein FRACYDRAFT_271658 [Fragilariopsis cylindrus CCMP1102]|uniref:Uncharacterized protein n=1 Tax=Fragilariopsis cylindrus CCMP1102 TaxID=635003 RepID=A0A1E7ERS0_9STRA|nr:hypothetical protein FRACYDRAFT_271658 [Fragilariopsis cylindrus CCMP1102]|eukprot:OEU08612.1 hypothetical protein FRACYDRAFT_271658 [Fragilariopsis cylindrus CCMP1102]